MTLSRPNLTHRPVVSSGAKQDKHDKTPQFRQLFYIYESHLLDIFHRRNCEEELLNVDVIRLLELFKEQANIETFTGKVTSMSK